MIGPVAKSTISMTVDDCMNLGTCHGELIHASPQHLS